LLCGNNLVKEKFSQKDIWPFMIQKCILYLNLILSPPWEPSTDFLQSQWKKLWTKISQGKSSQVWAKGLVSLDHLITINYNADTLYTFHLKELYLSKHWIHQVEWHLIHYCATSPYSWFWPVICYPNPNSWEWKR